MTVDFGLTSCTTASIVATTAQITCTLAKKPTAGDWNVKVSDPKGLIPTATALVKINVPLVITSISPNKAFNQLGGDIMQVTGTGYNPDKAKNSVIFSDNTECTALAVTETQLDCVINGFDQNNILSQYPTKVKVITENAAFVE